MTLTELDSYFRSFLHFEDYTADPSRNGIQIENSAPSSKPIKKVAFAVDACVSTAQKAAKEGADVLFVHHGLFWGECKPITSVQYQRVNAFLSADLALYAAHIPLDANEEVGNNYGLARRIGLKHLKPFGEWRYMSIGVQGRLEKEVTLEELSSLLFPCGEKPLHLLPFGKPKIRSVAIISGGAGEDVTQAKEAGVDAYITGEILHEEFHLVKDLGINAIAGGHYQTETVGVQLVAQKLKAEKGIETVFIDFNTGM